ncbi:MAG: hypothetical protein LBK66_04385 [Spirochaetaceae bacterium]|nr:hypothetical protein [Spirochaetaceae bacterium]
MTMSTVPHHPGYEFSGKYNWIVNTPSIKSISFVVPDNSRGAPSQAHFNFTGNVPSGEISGGAFGNQPITKVR